MAVTLTGSAVALFDRLGTMGIEYLRVVDSYGTDLDTSVETIRDGFETGAQSVVVDNIYANRNSYKGVHTSWLGSLQTMMQNTVIEQVNDDSPLQSKSINLALAELIRQMKASSDSILAPTTSASVTAFSGNKGDAKFLLSFTNEFGDALTMPYPETIRFNCTSAAPSFGEQFTIVGAPQKPVTDANWPGGSGATGAIGLFDATTSSYLTNGNFADWSVAASPPANWTYDVGTGGTTIVRDSSTKRSTGYSVQFVSNGSVLHKIRQQVSSSLLATNNVLCLQFWAKVSVADAAGVLRVRLVDGTGTVITNDAGNNLSTTFDTNTTIGTSYTSCSVFFQLPRQLPTTGVFLVMEMTTTMTSTRTLNISLVGLTKANPLYAAGPYCAAFSAALPHAVGDYFSAAVANNATNDSWVRAGQRWLNLPSLGNSFYFPSVTSSETVDDGLLS